MTRRQYSASGETSRGDVISCVGNALKNWSKIIHAEASNCNTTYAQAAGELGESFCVHCTVLLLTC